MLACEPAGEPSKPAPADTAELAADTATCTPVVRYADADGDGFGNQAVSSSDCNFEGVENGEDCDDEDATISPAAHERCNARDDDCDSAVDNDAVDAPNWYRDADGDGLGDEADSRSDCEVPIGYISTSGDCNDADANVLGPRTFYADVDSDGHGDPASTFAACERPPGWVNNTLDCDDTNAAMNPGEIEVCDGFDNDCDGESDEAGASGESSWYRDRDADGYGSMPDVVQACAQPAGYAGNASDCRDDIFGISPGATEVCNAVDDDCDRDIDESGASGETSWYADIDEDGYGDPTNSVLACTAPANHIADATDCADEDASVNPAATERCDESDVDDDCDGLADEWDPDLTSNQAWYADADGDGFGDGASVLTATCAPAGFVADAMDCDDAAPAIFPGADEACDATADQNCDGQIGPTDNDGDGFSACEECNDSDSTVSALGTESQNGRDDDCDGLVDEYGGDVVWTTEAEIAMFCQSFASVEGDLDIVGLASLRGLTCLRGVGGDLRIAGVGSTDVHGLERLTDVGGSVYFGGDLGGAVWLDGSAFTSLDGLDRLARVGGDFWAAHNQITGLDGALRLDTVGGGIILYDLPVTDAVLPVSSLGAGFWLERLPALVSVSAPRLTAMQGSLWFERVATDSGSFDVDWPLPISGTLGLVELPAGAAGSWSLPESVGGLWVSETELTDVAGLADLRTVAGDCVLADNPALTDIAGLDGITEIGGDLSLLQNGSLTDWGGFASLEHVEGRVRLEGDGPVTASGFPALSVIGEGLSIQYAGDLQSVSGFGALSEGGDLELYALDMLGSADGLAGAAFTGDVEVTSANKLEDLSFLANTAHISGSFTVYGNSRLASFDGTNAIQSIGGALTVSSNGDLTDLSMPALTEVGGALSLSTLRALTYLDLASLEHVGGDVSLFRLTLLPDLSGFSALVSVGGLWVHELETLVDLSGLGSLETVNESLIIQYNDQLASLQGANGLASVGTDLRVYANDSLVSLSGLDSLQSVGQDLTLKYNAALVRPDSLGSLQLIGRDLWVESNSSLEDFSGMGNFAVGNTVYLAQNRALITLDGLDSITQIPLHLVLYDLWSLTSVGPLSQLTYIGGDLRVTGAEVLPDLSGLDALESVGENVEIGYQWSWGWGEGNAALISLDGLGALTSVGGTLVVENNLVLADVDALQALESVGGNLWISADPSIFTADAQWLADGSPVVGGSTRVP